jgi:hypothetical protein
LEKELGGIMKCQPAELRLTSPLVLYCEQTDEFCTAEILINSDYVCIEFDKEDVLISRYVVEEMIKEGTFLVIDEL